MRVPLDYYRILGLPIQATAEQLKQAHRDRALQLPRREYSEAAITARKQLLDEAYTVLSDAEQRQAYDATFLAKSYELETDDLEDQLDRSSNVAIAADSGVDPYTPSIEIETQQLVGALLILLELGEYELVLKLGRPYLSSGSRSLGNGKFAGQSDIILADIVLTVALACLELGREQWQQGQYENAAESLQTGQELLLHEGLFASIRGEMQADLYKLRPYRILELLALPDERASERHKGLLLLQDMLQDRGGIDGNGDDQSGLNVDDFLRFIQQLRSYLTAAEQQAIFEAEARRPSAVATYLTVYALLARGFAEEQPALIRRSKLMLTRLGSRQDVHLEQAICALLLGQTEEASRALELSQEYESIAFIREHSQGSPDLLPGLCLYAEQWLQNEVFPQFRDLAEQRALLKDYFANEQVQAYLEELPNEPEAASWRMPQTTSNGRSTTTYPTRSRYNEHTIEQSGQSRVGASASTSATATLEAESRTAAPNSNMPVAERVSQLSPEENLNGGAAMSTGGGRSGRSPQTYSTPKRGQGINSLRVMQPGSVSSYRFGSKRRSLRLDRLLFLFALGFLGIGFLIFIGSKLTQASSGGAASLQTLNPGLDVVSQSLEPAQAAVEDPTAPLTDQKAQEVIQAWLQAKAAALGEDHNIEPLNQILAEPVLAQWRGRAEEAKAENRYAEYEHTLKVTSVTVNPETPDQAQVNAEVTENAKFYNDGQLDVEASYDDNLQVMYTLIRQNNQWLVQDMAVQ